MTDSTQLVGTEGTSSKAEKSCLPPCLIVLGMAGSGKSSFVQVKKQMKHWEFLYFWNVPFI